MNFAVKTFFYSLCFYLAGKIVWKVKERDREVEGTGDGRKSEKG